MPLPLALLPIVLLVALLGANVYFFEDNSSYGSNQIALLIAALFAGGIGMFRGVKWSNIKDAISSNTSQATEAIIILLLIGSLAGTWLLLGLFQLLFTMDVKILEPTFLFCGVRCLRCSFSCNRFFMGNCGNCGSCIDRHRHSAMGISEGWIAGAIISGAYFGDKFFRFLHTTNSAPAVAGTDLITHIKYMTITTVPSILIALAVLLVVGFTGDPTAETAAFAEGFGEAVNSKFNIHLGLFIAPVAVLVMIARKVPAAAALFIGVLLGALSAIVFQPEAIKEIAMSEMS